MRTFRSTSRWIFLTVVLLSCARNPATGGLQLMLVSEGQEIQMGRQADPEVVGAYGIYPDSGLQQYVRDIGNRLAAVSERPQLPWTFRVVDDPVINAFALPGGFIYMTRGILAHFNSEAQLAAVLGHEIGHVTARHSASQMSQQQLAQVGLGVSMILVPDLQDFAGLASAGLGILFLKFSRDDETQADQLGFRYIDREGFDLREMPPVFAMLGAVSRAAGGDRLPEWLSTHPDPENREGRIQRMVVERNKDLSDARVGRETYLRKLDGLTFGENPREGYFRDNTFLHPDLAFQLDFPEGWKTANQRQAVLGQSPDQRAIMELRLASEATPEAGARAFLAQEGVQGTRVESHTINGLPAASAGFRVTTNQGALRGTVTFLKYDGRLYRLLGYSTTDRWPGFDAVVRNSFASFDRLTDRAVLAVEPLRLQIVTLNQSMTLREFADRYQPPVSVERLALLNQVEPDQELERGRLVKHVVGKRAP